MDKGIRNTISINRPADEVFRQCINLAKWSDIFPDCKNVTFANVSQNEVVMEMTVANNLGVNRIRSHRKYDPNRRIIDFTLEAVPTSPGVVSGSWTIKEVAGETSLTITHLFKPNVAVSLEEQDQLTERMHAAMFSNTEHALESLKRWTESVL
jgi:ribosome-associated toxin RatA of RatAB toxin-antitoxin module